jgi:hypothetical protein
MSKECEFEGNFANDKKEDYGKYSDNYGAIIYA